VCDGALRDGHPFFPAGARSPIAARRRGAPAGSDFGDLLVTRAQVYTLCHDEVCRHVALHCAPLACFSAKLWAALAGVADAALRAYEDAHAECVEYRMQLEELVGTVGSQLEALREARGALAARLERSEGAVVELRARLRAAAKETALALEEAAGARTTAFAAATGLGRGGVGASGGGGSGGDESCAPPPLSTALFNLLSSVEAADNERRRQAALAKDQRALAAGAWALGGGEGALRWGAGAGAASVGVQTAAPRDRGGGARRRPLTWRLPVPASPPPRRAPDVPFEWRVYMSVFEFERPTRRMPPAAARRAMLQLLLDKGAFDRAAVGTTGVRLSLAQYVSEFFNHKFGLPALADQHATRLLLSIRGSRDARARLFDALAGGTVGLRDGRPLLGQAAFDFLAATVDDLRRAGALKDHVGEHAEGGVEGGGSGAGGGGGGGAGAGLQSAGVGLGGSGSAGVIGVGSGGGGGGGGVGVGGGGGDGAAAGDHGAHHACEVVPARVMARILRARFHFAPREFVARLVAPLAFFPAAAHGGDAAGADAALGGGGVPSDAPTASRPHSSPAPCPATTVDLDVALRLALVGWVEAQCAWEARVAAAFDRYSAPGVPYSSLRARDAGVTRWESGPGEAVAAGALARASTGGALARSEHVARSGLRAAVAAGLWVDTALRDGGGGGGGWGGEGPLEGIARLGPPGRPGAAGAAGGASALLPPPLLHLPQLHAAAAELWGPGGGPGEGHPNAHCFLAGGRIAVSDLFVAPESLSKDPAGAKSGALAFNMEDKRRRARAGGAGNGGGSGAGARRPPTAGEAAGPGAVASDPEERTNGGGEPALPPQDLQALFPPGWAPGMGVSGMLSGVRVSPVPPVFRPEDVVFADVDAYRENRYVWEGGWRPAARRRPSGGQRGSGDSGGDSSGDRSSRSSSRGSSRSSHRSSGGSGSSRTDSCNSGVDPAGTAAPERERRDAQRIALRAPLRALDSPVPLQECSPETLLALCDLLGEPLRGAGGGGTGDGGGGAGWGGGTPCAA
jgi:hypothetical protein